MIEFNVPMELNTEPTEQTPANTHHTPDNAQPDQENRPRTNARKLNYARRMKGDEYYGYKQTKTNEQTYKSAEKRRSKAMGPACGSSFCEKSTVRKCETITDEQRQNVFDMFWKNMNWEQRKTYVANLVDVETPKQRKTEDESRREYSYRYNLVINGERLNVCQTTFCHTFDLGVWSTKEWARKGAATERTAAQPQREPTLPHITLEKRQAVQDFLKALPTLPSHYCRQQSNKQYLEPEIKSMTKLYQMLREFCQDRRFPIPSRFLLSLEFRKKRLAFFQPKKDQCDTCCAFKTGNITEIDYRVHEEKKNLAREEKRKDKEESEKSDSVWTMDTQAVLLSPRLQASAMYYKTKLACHNFTMYNLKTGKVICYFWDESEGSLSSSNFTSCIRDCLSRIVDDSEIKRVILYSDGCGYQNRNVVLANALLEFSVAHRIEIVQKFLEKGHTQMEVDSVHSLIERKLKNRNIYFPGDYIEVFRECRPAKPFDIVHLTHDFFRDFSGIKYLDSVRPGKKAGEPQVHDLRALRYLPSAKVEFKTSFSDEYAELPQRVRQPRDRWEISRLHAHRIPIKSSKFKHLQELKTVMYSVHHTFYDSLPHKA